MARKVVLLVVLICFGGLGSAGLRAQASNHKSNAAADEAKIRAIMSAQSDAWNRGDIPGFMQGYEDSPETTFIGARIGKGYRNILDRYQRVYNTPEKMGTLTFSDVDVRLISGPCGKAEMALVTAKFHLQRKMNESKNGEGSKDEGLFSLVWRKGPRGWKIILDHTS